MVLLIVLQQRHVAHTFLQVKTVLVVQIQMLVTLTPLLLKMMVHASLYMAVPIQMLVLIVIIQMHNVTMDLAHI